MLQLALTVDWDKRQICLREPPDPKLMYLRWSISTKDIKVKGVGKMAVTIKDTEKISVEIIVTDAKGNPAKVDGTPIWNVSDPAGLSFLPSDDGFACDISAVGPLGNFQATVEVDADMGLGVKSLIGVLDIEVVAGEAVAVSFSVSAPSPA